MNWSGALIRILLLLAGGTAVGWFYGKPMAAALLVLAAVLAFWIFQLWLVQTWLQDPDQPPPDVQGVWGDILAKIYRLRRSERETRLELQSTADFFRGSFASMQDGVVIVNERGGIIWANDAAEKLTGLRYPGDEGALLSDLVSVPELKKYLVAENFSTPLKYCANASTGLYLQLVVTRFGEGDRLLFFRDMTALERLDKMRRDFIGNVSHELRTPLTVITGYLGTFLGTPDKLPPHYVKPMQQMVQQAERMENLIKDLLWLSRIESEEREEKRETIDVCAMLEELREELKNASPEREIRLFLESGHKVVGDYRELHSAVSNLAYNAIKYSPQHSPVTLSWRQVGDNVHLCVRDRGPGIEESHIPRLTERFYRVDDSRSADTGGTGIGLAIVKHVAVSHGAELTIDSRLGEGSAFTLVFPGAAVDAAPYSANTTAGEGL